MNRWLMLKKVCFLLFVLLGGPGGSQCELQDVNPFETPELSEVLGVVKETLDDAIGPGLVREATLAQCGEETKPRLVQTRSSPALMEWDEVDPVKSWIVNHSPEEASNELSFFGEDQIHNVKTQKRSVTSPEPDADTDNKEGKDLKIQDKMISKYSGTGLLHKDSLLIISSTPHPIVPVTEPPAGPNSSPASPSGVAHPTQDQEDLWDGLQPESLTTLRHSAANPDQRAWLDKYHLKERWRINAAKNRRPKLSKPEKGRSQIDHELHTNWHHPEVKNQLDSFLRKIKHRPDKEEDSMVYFRSFVSEKEGILSDAARKLQEVPPHTDLKLPTVVQ